MLQIKSFKTKIVIDEGDYAKTNIISLNKNSVTTQKTNKLEKLGSGNIQIK